MKFSVYQATQKGGRAINEDRLGYTYTKAAVLLVLADGMGGHPEGEKAAEIAVREFTQRFVVHAHPKLGDVKAFLENAIDAANLAILNYAREQNMADNPRTTLVAAVLQDNSLCAIHVGDSRLYWTRQGHVLARTRDHSYQEQSELFKNAPVNVNRSVLFTCLGSATRPIFDVMGPAPLQEGDRVLLCSDGLWGVMSDGDVAGGLHGMALKDAVTQLTDTALTKGGRHGDNVSVLALEWATPDDFAPTRVINTEQLDEGGAASTLQGVIGSDQVDDFDDEAIERSIAEINEAIRRTAANKRP